ncbi:hypothetical protein JXA85_01430 [Candidatus Woesearchaeota archaeon]|nr:hypothetical protein [Candidatus Woesearchaeota archaeon]
MKCCNEKNKNEKKGAWSGLLYGLLPHTGCIAFIVFTVLGVTAAASIFKPLLMNRYFFYILIGLSFVFATISATIYLKGIITIKNIRSNLKYLSVLYGSAIGVNLLLFLIVFPLATNLASGATGNAVKEGLSEITLKVDIPCPGHAPLITEELKGNAGVKSVIFRFPNYFDVSYDSSITSAEKIKATKIFNEFKIKGDETVTKQQPLEPTDSGSCGCGGSCGGCGDTCGGIR